MYLSELELVAIIRRMDTDGSCTVCFSEFAEFMRPITGIKSPMQSPPRTKSRKFNSPQRMRTEARLLDSPVVLAKSYTVERRVPTETYIVQD